MINLKNRKAITLIALVITIVVLIILAAVAINLSLGNNGIFNRAKTAKEQYQNAEDSELEKMNNYDDDISYLTTGSRTEFIGIYIKKRWTEGQNYYTVYSDGWVEQGGHVSGGTAIKNINLHIKMANTNYNIQCTSNYTTEDTTLYQPHVDQVTTTSFKSASYGERGSATNTGGVPVYWYAEGYGDKDTLENL